MYMGAGTLKGTLIQITAQVHSRSANLSEASLGASRIKVAKLNSSMHVGKLKCKLSL